MSHLCHEVLTKSGKVRDVRNKIQALSTNQIQALLRNQITKALSRSRNQKKKTSSILSETKPTTRGKKTLNTLEQRSCAKYVHFLIDLTQELKYPSLAMQGKL